MSSHRFVIQRFARIGAWLLATSFLGLLAGCKFDPAQVFSLSGPQSTIHVEGPVARAQDEVFMVTVWVTTFIFIVVGSVLAYAQIKFRAKSDADEHAAPPEQSHGNPFIEMGLIVASIVLLVIIAIPTLKNIWYTHDVPEAERANAMEVTATGYQWWFKFEYPTEMMKTADGGEAPLVTANELVVPVGTPVRVHLRTVDVIHSFWVPKLAGKVDMIPNRANFLWFKADKPGYYYGQCAEYCGDSHAIMKFRVIVLGAADYIRWLDNQKAMARTASAATARRDAQRERVQFASFDDAAPGSTIAGSPEFDASPFDAWKRQQVPSPAEDAALIARGRELFAEKSCLNCHTVRGHTNSKGIPYGGVTAPDLTHIGSRSTIAAGVLENNSRRLHQWLKDPEYFKPGNKMVHGIGSMAGYLKLGDDRRPVRDASGKYVRNIELNDEEIDALVAYLHSLK
jgi:cytochrome c oxidase subunit II